MKQKKGLSIIEVLVAATILAMVTGGAVACYVSIKQLSKEIVYRYTALNLAKEILEFGEAGSFIHRFAMKYYYPGATSNTIPPCEGFGSPGTDSGIGYRVKEWQCFAMDNPDPFDYLGDISARGLVPQRAPNSVSIYYYVKEDADFDNAFRQTVEVSWKEEEGRQETKETLSVIPVRQVNDQLRLTTAEFWWE